MENCTIVPISDPNVISPEKEKLFLPISDPTATKNLKCLVCSKFLPGGENCRDISSPYCKTSLSQSHVTETISCVLGCILVQSMLVCARCFTLLDTVDTLQVQIKLKKSEISNLYENSTLDKDKNIDTSFITTSDSNQNVSLSSEYESELVKSRESARLKNCDFLLKILFRLSFFSV